jgi:hypothetical protein
VLAGMAPKNFENYIQHLFEARFLILLIALMWAFLYMIAGTGIARVLFFSGNGI